MKKIKQLLVFSAALLTLASCGDFLNQTPRSDIIADDYWQSDKDVEKWMNGIYNGLQESWCTNVRWWGEGRSDNYFPTTYGNGSAFQKNAITASMAPTDWTSLYTVIGRCNIAIQKIPQMESVTDAKKEQYLAECHGIRALTYFYMIRLWGDCPLILEPWDLSYETKYNARQSVRTVARSIENDVDTSIEYFLSSDSRIDAKNTVFYFNLATAYALKMDLLVYLERYDEVPAVYEDFTADHKHALVAEVADWKEIFTKPEESTETIFSLAWNQAHNTSRIYSNFAGAIGFAGSAANFAVGKDIYLLMVQDLDDIRMWGVMSREGYNGEFIASNAPVYGMGNTGSNGSIERTYKFIPNGSEPFVFPTQQNYFFPCPVYRYADVLLLYAEAINRLGDGEGALDIVNQIRQSRGSSISFEIENYPVELGGGRTSRERVIMDERQLEFFNEGKRWFDLCRMEWGYDIIDAHVEYLQYQSNEAITGFGRKSRMLLPIYLSNLANNAELVQNDGY